MLEGSWNPGPLVSGGSGSGQKLVRFRMLDVLEEGLWLS